MVCLPATQFGCGCSVTFGVKFVLLLNLAANLFFIATTVAFLCFGVKGMGIGSYAAEVILLGFSLGGVPIILMAFSGVLHRNEAQIRIYLYYLWVVILALVVVIVRTFIFGHPCEHMPIVFAADAKAFACGMMRWANIAIVIVTLAILAYFQHVVFSHCEDLAECGGGPVLGDLVLNKDFYVKRDQSMSVYSSIEGLAESGDGYEGAVSNGLGGGQPIFGSYHDMSYKSPYQ